MKLTKSHFAVAMAAIGLTLSTASCTKPMSDIDIAWQRCDSVLQTIQAPTFPDAVFSISDYNNDINATINAASAAGGGKVVVPAGTYTTGPITMQSNINLHLEEGSVLLFDTNPELYTDYVYTRWEGCDCYNLHPLIYANGCENIGLTGKGTLNAQGDNEHWWPMVGAARFGWKEGMISQAGRDHVRETSPRQRLLDWCANETPIEERRFTLEDGMRPQFVNFVKCNKVLIEGVTLLNSPFWVLHPLFCDDLTVRGVTIINEGPNGDGCDPESCNRVLIEDCVFHTGDDCIAIKSGRNQDGRNCGIPSQNIIVRNCKMEDGHGGVVVGSEIAGGYKNLWVENCQMDSPNLERVIRIKTNNLRGGVIENIYVRNVEVGVCKQAVLRVNLTYEPKEIGIRGFNPTVRNVIMQNVTCQGSEYAVVLNGLEDVCNIYNIRMENCEFNNVRGGKQGDINWTEGQFRDIVYDNVRVNGNPIDDLSVVTK